MKNLLLLCFTFLAAQTLSAQSEKTLVKTLDPKNADFIVFTLPANASFHQPTKWDNNTLRVELEVHANMTEDVMVQLIKANRYTFDGQLVDGVYTISAPNLEKKVTIKQVDLVEKIYINVTAPHNYTLDPAEKKFSRDITDFISSRGTGTRSITSANLLKMRQFSEPIEVHVRFVSTLSDNADTSKAADKTKKTSSKVTTKPTTPLKHGDILIDDVIIDPF